ncbi:MAG TPA: hypothetical protein PKI19_02010 [Elusimicrobiales bacterium]|nr:hypothetical protein [Elusimicrobiales bacterium]
MEKIKKYTSLTLSLLLLFSSIPQEAAAYVAGCTLDWTHYNYCVNSAADCAKDGNTAAFKACNASLKASAAYKQVSTQYASTPDFNGSKEKMMLSYSYSYTEAAGSIPATCVTAKDKASYQSHYAAGMLKYKDVTKYTLAQKQAICKYFAQEEVKKEQAAAKKYEEDKQKLLSGNMLAYKTEPMRIDNAHPSPDVMRSMKIQEDQWNSQLKSEELSAKNVKLAQQTNANNAKYNTGPKTAKDLVPVALMADAGMHTQYSIIPARNKDFSLKKDIHGNQMYDAIPFLAPNTPLSLDEVKITWTGKPAIASMTAIARDLLNFYTTDKAKRPTSQRLAYAATILMAMLNTREADAAINKLGLIGGILLSYGETKVSTRIIQTLAGRFSNDKDAGNRETAAMALAMIGSAAPGSPMTKNIIDLLSNKAENNTKSAVTIGDRWYQTSKVPGGNGDDLEVRITAMVALAGISSEDSVYALGYIPQSYKLFTGEACDGDKCDKYYYCNPKYSMENNAKADLEDQAANDGSVQCMGAQILASFFDPAAGEQQKKMQNLAYTQLKDLANETLCGFKQQSSKYPYFNQVFASLPNYSIHATMALSSIGKPSEVCLQNIAHHVSVWEGNKMSIPCNVIEYAREEIGSKQMACNKQVLWNEVIGIVGNIVKGILVGLTVKVGVGAIAANLHNAGKACYLLATGIKALEAGEQGYGVYEKVVMGKEIGEMALILKELAAGGEGE